jgi:hypothetical protein
MQIIEEMADEGSSFYLQFSFYDEQIPAQAFVPDTLFWSLTDMHGNAINSRSAVTVAVPASTLSIALTGADLAILGNDIGARIITIWGTWTSGTFGANQTLLFQTQFNIQPRVGQ